MHREERFQSVTTFQDNVTFKDLIDTNSITGATLKGFFLRVLIRNPNRLLEVRFIKIIKGEQYHVIVMNIRTQKKMSLGGGVIALSAIREVE